jgi:hypothetical protein
MRDVTQTKTEELLIFTASNTKGTAWMQNYYGSRSVSFGLEERTRIIEFERALRQDGVVLSAL